MKAYNVDQETARKNLVKIKHHYDTWEMQRAAYENYGKE